MKTFYKAIYSTGNFAYDAIGFLTHLFYATLILSAITILLFLLGAITLSIRLAFDKSLDFEEFTFLYHIGIGGIVFGGILFIIGLIGGCVLLHDKAAKELGEDSKC